MSRTYSLYGVEVLVACTRRTTENVWFCSHSGPIQGMKEKGKWEMAIRCKKTYASMLIGKDVRGCKRDGKAVLEFSEIESHWECKSICAIK